MPLVGSNLRLRRDPGRMVAWKPPLRGWHLVGLAGALLILLPLGAVGAGGLAAGWSPLAARLFTNRLVNTILVALPITVTTVFAGAGAAWLLFRYQIPGSGVLSLALMLPLTVPAYIAAAVFAGVFSPGTPAHALLAAAVGWIPSRYPSPSFAGPVAVWFVMSVVLFPYVYALSRSAYSRTLVPLLESAESLGSSRNLFFTFALPLARPAIVAGAGLVLMEVLNEYGTMVYLGHSTLTTGVFQAWFLHGDLAAARSLALGILILILLLQRGEARLRGSSRFAPVETGSHYRRRKLSPGRRILAASFLWGLVTVGFAIPVGGIVVLALRGASSSATLWSYVRGSAESGATTALLAIGATAIALALALCLAYARRLVSRRALSSAVSLAALGYAVPGAVIGLGVLTLGSLLSHLSGGALVFAGSVAALIFAYQVRFFAVVYRSTDAALGQVHGSLGESARLLGASPLTSLFRVEGPLIRRSLLAAGLLFFVDVVKELPLTLILRPFNTRTLAIHTFELVAGERLVEASFPALLLILLSTIPSIFAFRLLERKEQRK